jgi:Fic family protein
MVRSPRARNKITKLPHSTSLLDLRAALPAVRDREEKEGLRIFSLESALIACSPNYFSSHSTDVRAVLSAFFDLLREETHPAVRVVLGHSVFVYIHPYMDGNGRVARFLMNVMVASGGYPWTVIPVEDRNAYVEALERASVGEDIGPFAEFLAGLVGKRLSGEPLPAVPKASS